MIKLISPRLPGDQVTSMSIDPPGYPPFLSIFVVPLVPPNSPTCANTPGSSLAVGDGEASASSDGHGQGPLAITTKSMNHWHWLTLISLIDHGDINHSQQNWHWLTIINWHLKCWPSLTDIYWPQNLKPRVSQPLQVAVHPAKPPPSVAWRPVQQALGRKDST